ncbi:hypothetical protein [Deinococcus sp. YIM 77859]|uniref:hypothetical protein n=1 Tax=Deinococcus sp. YIM 77859 TaxID=1540221 RepID=UPI000557CED9|nr:hypothetical protein [Deinococcus sp. YIM 77859]
MRTFLLILLAFVAGVLMMVAAFAWQGRAARGYGQEAVQAATRAGLTSTETPCSELLKREPPSLVEACVVKVEGTQKAATVTLEGGRTFRVGP